MEITALIQRTWRPITALVWVAITVLSVLPLPELPEVPGSDKTHHLVAYSALMLPAFLARSTWRYYLLLVFCLWGGAIELIQPLVNRYGEWQDWIANSAGLFLGMLLGMIGVRLQGDCQSNTVE